MTEKSAEEILSFLNDKKSLESKGIKELAYIENFQNKSTEHSKAHWGIVGNFLKNHKIVMVNKDNEIYNFVNDIKAFNKQSVSQKREDREKNWFERNLEKFDALIVDNEGESGNKGHFTHVRTFILALLNLDYKFELQESLTEIDDNKLPHCQELYEIAKSVREQTGIQQPQPEQIFDIWQTHNKTKLNAEQCEKLKYQCFKKK